MSELKGQMLGMILVLAAFSTIFAVLMSSFQQSAENVAKQIDVDDSGSLVVTDGNEGLRFSF